MTLRRFTSVILLLLCTASFGQNEDWAGYEGGNLHHNSSAIDVAPSTIGILWKREFDKVIQITDAWCYCTPKGCYGSRNLAITNGYIPVVAYDGLATPSNLSFDKVGYVTILNCKTGSTVNAFKGTIADGPRHCVADAADNLRGLAMLNWDPKSDILNIMNGGDGSGFSAYLPLKNLATYQKGYVQNGVGAFNWIDRSPMKNYELPGPGPNATAFYETDTAYPTIVYTTGTHSVTSPFSTMSKYIGSTAGISYKNNFVLTGIAPFAKWGSVITGNNRFFCMGPKDAATLLGLNIWAYNVKWKNNFPHVGWDTLTDFDVMEMDTAFFRSVNSKNTNSGESYNENDGYYRNKAWLIDGKGVWVAWKPDKAGNSELVYCDESVLQKYDLGVDAGSVGSEVWPHISLAQSGGTKYIVYYSSNSKNNSKLSVFNASSKTLSWTYDVSANYTSLKKAPAIGYIDHTHLVVAGKYAYIGWIDLQSADAVLSLLVFDLTAGSAAPVQKKIPLGFVSASYKNSVLTDIAATNGILYALVTKSDSLQDNSYFDSYSKWQSQIVLALAEPDVTAPVKSQSFFASKIFPTYATLNWTPAQDKIGVIYNVYQDGKLIVTTQDTVCQVMSLVNGKTYEFVLEPVDFAGNKGTKDTLSVITGNYQSLQKTENIISVYPNPASEIVNIESTTGISQVSVYSGSGVLQVSNSFSGEKSCTIPVNDLPAGMYLIRVVTDTDVLIKSIFKE